MCFSPYLGVGGGGGGYLGVGRGGGPKGEWGTTCLCSFPASVVPLPSSMCLAEGNRISGFGVRKNFLRDFFSYPTPPPEVPTGKKKLYAGTSNFFSTTPLAVPSSPPPPVCK